jgi:hypothetical protein
VTLDPALLEALEAIGPYLEDTVLSGGWVPRVYAEVERPEDDGGILVTRDIDLAVPRALVRRAETLDDLLKGAGFTCEMLTDGAVPVMHFIARRDEPDELEVEFITPAAGSNDGPLVVQTGVTAQAVKFGHLLLENTWEVSLADLGFDSASGSLRLPTPAAFALNKSLTFPRRRDRAKREKDLYYLFYVVACFPSWHDWMLANLASIAEERRPWVKKAEGLVERACLDESADGIDAILRQRPRAAFLGLDTDQFRQLVIATMGTWLDMLRAAVDRL